MGRQNHGLRNETSFGDELLCRPFRPFQAEAPADRGSGSHGSHCIGLPGLSSQHASKGPNGQPVISPGPKGRQYRIPPTHSDVLLLIEVSDSSTEHDLGEKARLYAEHDIPEYWVVDIQTEQIHVHRTPNQGSYQSIQSSGKSAFISPLCQPTATLSLAE
ncbi:MAG: Uma2 family endonuclease, partial [Planctomycetes bacterium]|nr:Uma2 family endonuclease [Planctomycetota bacterium]